MAAPAAPSVPISQRWSPEALSSRIPWAFLALLSQGIGLLLIFLGTIIQIAFGYVPISCVDASSCSQSTFQGIVYGIDAARLLWVVGLFGLAVGAGLHLQFRPAPSSPLTPEDARVYLARRRGELVMLVLSLLLLFLILLLSTGSVIL